MTSKTRETSMTTSTTHLSEAARGSRAPESLGSPHAEASTRPASRGRRARGFLAAAAVLAAGLALGLSRGASAQGADGAFPDPISSALLDRFADLLGLDAAERSELTPYHEAYRAKMRELRDGPIADYIKENRGGALFGSPKSRAEVEANVRIRTQVLGQIERAERELIDRIATGLDEAQQPAVERVRLLAERERVRGLFGPFGGSAAAQRELRDLVEKLELDETARAATNPLLDAHERALTKRLGDLGDLVVKQPLALADATAAAGITRPAMPGEGAAAPGDPAALPSGPPDADIAADFQRYFAEMGRLRSAVGRPQREVKQAIAALNRQSVAKLRAVLPERAGEQLADRFLARAYRSIASDPGSAGRTFDTAVGLAEKSGAPGSVADGLGAARAEWRRRIDGVLAQLMDEVDAGQADRSPFMFGAEDDEELKAHLARLGELEESRTAINRAAIDQARALLGPELAAKLGGDERRVANGPPGDAAIAMEMIEGMEIIEEDGAVMITVSADLGGGAGGGGGDGIAVVGGGASRGPLPGPIATQELNAMAARLGVTETTRPIVEVLHDEYDDAFSAAREEARQAVAAATAGPAGSAGPAAAPKAPDGPAGGGRFTAVLSGGEFRVPSESEIVKQHQAFRRGIDSLAGLDRSFFDDLHTVVGDAEASGALDGLRSARERAVYRQAGRGPGMGGMMFMGGAMGGREPDVDLFELWGELASEGTAVAAAEPAIAPILSRYATQATATARQRFETTIAARQELDIFNSKAMTRSAEGDNVEVNVNIGSDSEGFEQMQQAQRRIAEADRTVAELNRSFRDEVMAALPEAERTGFRRAYARKAWPNVYRDRGEASAKLTAAAALADLTDNQQRAIASLATEHAEAYEALCDQMVAVETASGGSQSDFHDVEMVRRFAERQGEMKKLRFERTERSATTLRALGGILSAEQVATIGGVAMPEAPKRGMFEFGR